MKFRTKYDTLKPVSSDPGSPIKKEYQLRETKDGLDLVEIGETNLYKYIQSHADSVDIHKILERCAMIDDYGLLDRVPGVYMDITEMPKSLAEAYDQIQNAKDLFSKMPLEVRESYNNNFVEFISSIGSEKFLKVTKEAIKKMSVKDVPVDVVIEKENVKDSVKEIVNES